MRPAKISVEWHQTTSRGKHNSSESAETQEIEKKSVTQSVFELQKKYSSQNSRLGNFQNILLNKLLPRRPLTSIFGNRNMKNSCWQLMTAVDSSSDISIIIYSLRLINEPNFIWIRWSGAEILRFEVWFEEFCLREIDREREIDR